MLVRDPGTTHRHQERGDQDHGDQSEDQDIAVLREQGDGDEGPGEPAKGGGGLEEHPKPKVHEPFPEPRRGGSRRRGDHADEARRDRHVDVDAEQEYQGRDEEEPPANAHQGADHPRSEGDDEQQGEVEERRGASEPAERQHASPAASGGTLYLSPGGLEEPNWSSRTCRSAASESFSTPTERVRTRRRRPRCSPDQSSRKRRTASPRSGSSPFLERGHRVAPLASARSPPNGRRRWCVR